MRQQLLPQVEGGKHPVVGLGQTRRQHQPPHPLGVPGREPYGHQGAHRVADDGEGVEPGRVGLCDERVGHQVGRQDVRARGGAGAGEVGRHHGVVRDEGGDQRREITRDAAARTVGEQHAGAGAADRGGQGYRKPCHAVEPAM
ncbi:hypothetical protein GCM10010319_04230 [Streptomyces blastmyceticus]|uniref:Uncharacterized protein n=1 Tax=Streptomyces blastmyceticus TaxID=68180 RepID=A0ABN0WBF3_9ACTN